MDPDECLKEIRAQLIIYNLSTDDHELMTAAGKVCELVEAMDTWLTTGGFLPNSWAGAPVPPRSIGDARLHELSLQNSNPFPGAGEIRVIDYKEDM